MDLFKLPLTICRSHGSQVTPGPKGLASAHKRQRADVGGISWASDDLAEDFRTKTFFFFFVVRFTPWKINMNHNDGGLEDHFPFQMGDL